MLKNLAYIAKKVEVLYDKGRQKILFHILRIIHETNDLSIHFLIYLILEMALENREDFSSSHPLNFFRFTILGTIKLSTLTPFFG